MVLLMGNGNDIRRNELLELAREQGRGQASEYLELLGSRDEYSEAAARDNMMDSVGDHLTQAEKVTFDWDHFFNEMYWAALYEFEAAVAAGE